MSRDSGSVARVSAKRVVLVAEAAYLGLLGILLVGGLLDDTRSRSATIFSFLVPLMALGAVTAYGTAQEAPARMARFWRHFGMGCAGLGVSFAAWAIAVTSESTGLQMAAALMTVASFPLLLWALIGRIRTVGSFFRSRLDLLDLAVVSLVTLAFSGYFIMLPLAEKTEPSLAVLLAGSLVISVGALYAIILVLRQARGTVRPADRYMLVPITAIVVYDLAFSLHMLAGGSSSTPVLGWLGVLALAPLPVTPLFDRGAGEPPARLEESEQPARRGSTEILVSMTLMLGLTLLVQVESAHDESRRMFVVGILVLVMGVVVGRQLLMYRENRALSATQTSLARLWEREAGRAHSLLVLSRRVVEGDDLGSILDAALSAATSTTGAKRAFFLVTDLGRDHCVVPSSSGVSPEEVRAIEHSGFDPLALSRAYRTGTTGRTVVLHETVVAGLSDGPAAFGVRSFAAVPVGNWSEDGIGFLCCDSGAEEHEFDDEDVEMLEAVADQVGLALSRIRLIRELAASEERYRVLVEEATDGVWELDLDDKIVYSNHMFAEMTGLPISSLLGKRLDEVVNVRSDSLQDHSEAGGRELTATVRREGGDTSILEIRTSVRRDGKVQAVGRDVTERYQAAERINSLYRALEEKERARTNLLSRIIRASEDERSRLSADIHDGPVQSLSTLVIRLDLARSHMMRRLFGEADKLMVEVRKSLSDEVMRLRHLMMELRPPVLDERGLFDAIDAYVRSFEFETGIAIAFERRGELSCDKTLETVLYRIVQEALINVRKHAEAETVRVLMEAFPDGGLLLQIADNGVGFDVEAAGSALSQGHIGLASIRERAELAGGRCDIDSEPGRGTTIRVSIGAPVESHVG